MEEVTSESNKKRRKELTIEGRKSLEMIDTLLKGNKRVFSSNNGHNVDDVLVLLESKEIYCETQSCFGVIYSVVWPEDKKGNMYFMAEDDFFGCSDEGIPRFIELSKDHLKVLRKQMESSVNLS